MSSLIFLGIGLFGAGGLVGIGICILDKSEGMVFSSYHPPIILKEE